MKQFCHINEAPTGPRPDNPPKGQGGRQSHTSALLREAKKLLSYAIGFIPENDSEGEKFVSKVLEFLDRTGGAA